MVSLYLLLGLPGSGRREILLDLAENGFSPTDDLLVLWPATETGQPTPPVFPSGPPRLAFQPWTPSELPSRLAAAVRSAPHALFLVLPGDADPVDQIESLLPLLGPASGLELARVITVVHSALVQAHPPLATWYDACVHFSDVVLLHRRESVSNRWVDDFIGRYEKAFFPCVFERVKKDGLANPAAILEPEPRRMALVFEDLSPLPALDIQIEIEESDLEDEDAEDAPAPDPWFERLPSGQRRKPLPDVRPFL